MIVENKPLAQGKCSSCGADIIWVKTGNGKAMPLSVASREKRWTLVRETAPGYFYRAQGTDDRVEQHDTYHSHFVDCPNAAQHRKPK